MGSGTDGPFGLLLAFYADQGRAVHIEPLPARIMHRFGRAGQFAAKDGCSAWKRCTVTLRPIGLPRGEFPAFCDGLELTLRDGDVRRVWELPYERFAPLAQQVVNALAIEGALAPGETCTWRLMALPAGEGVPAGCVIESPIGLPPVRTCPGTRPNGVGVRALHPALDFADDVPLFFSRQAVEQAIAFCQGDPAVERGGVFLGRLHIDQVGLFVLSQAFLPAWDAPAEIQRVRFDRATWERIHQQRKAHGEGDVIAWLHSHVRMQDESGGEQKALMVPSAQDVAIHAAFYGDRHLACVIVDPVAEDPSSATAIWGWDRYGVTLRPRTLFIYGG